MSERKIVVPEGMLSADHQAWIAQNFPGGSWDREQMRVRYAAALQWLSENPVVPTQAEQSALRAEWDRSVSPQPPDYIGYIITWWQRRMFLVSDEDAPIKDLLEPQFTSALDVVTGVSSHDRCVREAYKRGQRSGQCLKP